MILHTPHSDRAVQEYRARSGAKNTYWLNEIVKYVKSEGLWDSFRLYPFMDRTNAGTGSTAYGLGGLTANEMTLVNGPTWGAGGLAFASASSQYGQISDFSGSETLMTFSRVSFSTATPSVIAESLVSQFDNPSNASFSITRRGNLTGDPFQVARRADGTVLTQELYTEDSPAATAADQCIIAQWVDAGGRSLWVNKTSKSMSITFGTAQTSRFNSSAPILVAASDSVSPSSFFDGTYHALAFITGSLTDTQRETLTDLINLVGSPPPLHALREYVAETGATDTLTLTRLTRYVTEQGLWDNFALYSMMPNTNYDSGSSVKVLGGLTANDMTLVNGPTWGASGIAFASASSQYGTIADFLGNETLTAFARLSHNSASPSNVQTLFSQYYADTNNLGFLANYQGNVAGDPYRMARTSDGTASTLELYSESSLTKTTEDQCLVFQWQNSDGRSLWQNKTSIGLSLVSGSAQSSTFNASVNILIGAAGQVAISGPAPTNFCDQTTHAYAFLTGSVTTAQRETITDLINAL